MVNVLNNNLIIMLFIMLQEILSDNEPFAFVDGPGMVDFRLQFGLALHHNVLVDNS